MKKFLRHRTAIVWLVPLLVMAALWFTDPDRGASTWIWIVRMVTVCIAVALAHWYLKGLHDYPEADRRTLLGRARNTPEGAGLALIAQALIFAVLVWAFVGQARAQDAATFIPPQARQYLPVLGAEIDRHWPAIPQRAYPPALIEHESGCFSMPRKCWNPASRLKSAREEGAGLGQVTRAYRADGTLRFDALQEMRERHPALREWSWENVYQRADLQLRAVVLKVRDDYRALAMVADPTERMAFADAAYNGGRGGVMSERRACGLVAGCDPQRWFGHVENHCLKSRVALYGNRSACDINRTHVVDTMRRTPKYRGLV